MNPRVRTEALDSAEGLLDLLDAWVGLGWLRALDHAFAAFLHQQAAPAPPLLLLGAALASHQLGRGHVCLDLGATLADPDRSLSLPPEGAAAGAVPGPASLLRGMTAAAWAEGLSHPELVSAGVGDTPLVCAGGRLYLRRFWACEQYIGAAVRRRLGDGSVLRAGVDAASVRAWLDRLFGPPGQGGTDWQRVACALAAGGRFTVVTGGPGTGKTTTVVRLLALLQALRQEAGHAQPLRIRMAAPTGKAAARLGASVAGAVHELPLPGDGAGARIRAAIPTDVGTVHRLLGSRPGSRHFRHGSGNPLALDVLVVDEASMIDLELMTAVFQALPHHARLILLGDRDQLASVEAGAVLGEICARAGGGHYTAASRDWLRRVSGEEIPGTLLDARGRELDQHIVMLRRSYRFGEDSAIGSLARAVNAGDAAAARAILSAHGMLPDLAAQTLHGAGEGALERRLVHGGAEGFRPAADGARPAGHADYLRRMIEEDPGDEADPATVSAWAGRVLEAHRGFQLLCALRHGPWGVEHLNRRVEAALRAEGLITGRGVWYAGRPVMVTANDYGLGLMNGDIGVTLGLAHRDADGRPGRALRVAFPATDGSDGIRWVQPSRLTRVETVYAMTVHKAQGSEFAHTALLLPDREAPVLTRELLYTAITRARRWFTLIEPAPGILEQAIQRRVIRGSGLGAALDDSTLGSGAGRGGNGH
ncbi:exodeoxyribonuclease V subunit alpha [Thioalkalivibrio sp.]|uniref:exodeoxyribonuclease V subunit alpha n=1 Tax=Thioalkalivibrio sp. TaxID=2093813 RepID=UPI00356208C7